ncbi:MAG: sulfurtransferase [Gemmatimonadetes bacterium]|nr:sulfurtransferase [Gemmatimonadota bacterium]
MKAHKTLIGAAEVAKHLSDPGWAVFDCRFAIRETASGRAGYLAAHIPGAAYVHLDDQLSGPIIKGKTGRHPLPDPQVMAERFGTMGIDDRTQVVAYDDTGGSMAVRLWWLLRWLGHDACAVLDGGWKAWQDAALSTRTGEERHPPRAFTADIRPELVADAALVDRARADEGWLVADARASDRYRGENETIDPVAGHIPGAVSLPFAENLDANGRFLPAAELARRFRATLGYVPVSHVVLYCGSGVTAAHDAFAIAHAGMGDARVYAGSWSEWILDPRRPVATGDGRG